MTSVFDIALKKSLEYFGGDEIAAQKFISKYALKDTNGNLLEHTPDDMHHRLAREFARIEAKYANPMSEHEIYSLLKDFKYIIPQGSPMSGIGNEYQTQSLSNCFVIEQPYDSYGGILKADQEQVQIMKRRGGVGIDISTIRPKGLRTANAALTTDGIEVFMERFSNSCREVAQGGRRGALMLTIDCHHPQIRDFIKIKNDLKKVTGANISIKLSDEFMTAVKCKTEVQLRFPVEKDATHTVSSYVDAKEIWDEMIEAAHNFAEPGLLFWDTCLRRSPADIYSDFGFKSISTNPCGEVILSAYDSCRLIVINLLSFVKNSFTHSATFDFKKFDEVTQKAQRLMDDLVDLEIECVDKIIRKIKADPEPMQVKQQELDLWYSIKSFAVKGRRTGLGVTALGDTLASLNLRYGSDASISVVGEIYKAIALSSYKSSSTLASERGAFPIHDYELEKNHEFLRQLFDADPELEASVKKYGRRNIACNTTAPCGTVSLMTQTTSGVEPAYMLNYLRRAKISESDQDAPVAFTDELGDKWQEFDVFHHGYAKWAEVTGNSLKDVNLSPYWKATSNDIDWRAKINVQAAAQKWVDHSISNTTNIPKDTPIDVTADIYMAGWETGCKGVTIYRDGSRTGVLVSKDDVTDTFKHNSAPKRPEKLPCDIKRVTIRGEEWTVLVGLYKEKPYELFGGLSKYVEIPKKYNTGFIVKNSRKTMNSIYDLQIGTGDDVILIKNIAESFDNPNYSSTTRLISLSLRHGANMQYVVEQLQKDKEADMFSFVKCISRVLKSYIKDGTETNLVKTCPQCSATKFAYQEGCPLCVACGWQSCG